MTNLAISLILCFKLTFFQKRLVLHIDFDTMTVKMRHEWRSFCLLLHCYKRKHLLDWCCSAVKEHLNVVTICLPSTHLPWIFSARSSNNSSLLASTRRNPCQLVGIFPVKVTRWRIPLPLFYRVTYLMLFVL